MSPNSGVHVLPISATSGTWPPPMAVTNWSWALAHGTNCTSTRSPGWAASNSVGGGGEEGPQLGCARLHDPDLERARWRRSSPADGVSAPQPGQQQRRQSQERARARRIKRSPSAWRLLDESNTRPARAPRAAGVARRAAPARASPAGGMRSAAGKVARIRARNGSSRRASGAENRPPTQEMAIGVVVPG